MYAHDRRAMARIAVVLALAGAGRAAAVPEGAVSWTARAVCDYRAVASLDPDPRVRNRDDLAPRLCEPALLPHDYDAAREVIDTDPEAYSGYFYVNARTHHVDDVLEAAAANGVTQVVVLGAGFDSRAYRFAAAHPALAFFEVDLPASSRAKQQAVRRVLGAPPASVRYVAADIDAQPLDALLPRAGYDPARRTLFILEGVTMYVTPPANDATFAFIHDHAAPGSVVVFDFVWRRVVDGDRAGLYAAGKVASQLARLGEPFLCGWTPAEAEAFARRHGLRVTARLDAPALTRRYLIRSDGSVDGRIPEWYGIIDAELPGDDAQTTR